jgi:hypothetical protein
MDAVFFSRNVDNHLPDSRSQTPEDHNMNFLSHESLNITNNFHKTIVWLVRDKGNSDDFLILLFDSSDSISHGLRPTGFNCQA